MQEDRDNRSFRSQQEYLSETEVTKYHPFIFAMVFTICCSSTYNIPSLPVKDVRLKRRCIKLLQEDPTRRRILSLLGISIGLYSFPVIADEVDPEVQVQVDEARRKLVVYKSLKERVLCS